MSYQLHVPEPRPRTERKPRILMLHGFFSCPAAWEPLLSELGDEVEAIVPDLLGYGAHRPYDGDYTLDHLVDHLEPLLGREPTHLLGHSMGGIVSLALAGRHPGLFERIAIVGLPVYRDRCDALQYLHRRGWVYRAILHSNRAAHAGCEAMLRTKAVWSRMSDRILPGHPNGVLAGAFRHSLAAHEALDSIVFGAHVDRLAGRVCDPVVLIHGGRDKAAPPDRARDVAGQHRWQFDFHPRHGHQAVITRPRYYANWLRSRLLTPRSPQPGATPALALSWSASLAGAGEEP